MERELQLLREHFELINVKAFCGKYNLQYDYLRKVLKGEFTLTENKYAEYCTALKQYRELLSDIQT